MQLTLGLGEAIAFLLIVGSLLGYLSGWRRLRRAMPALATRYRLLAFSLAALALTAALVWPLPSLGNYLLGMRSLQKVAVCFIAAPLFWLAVPVHTYVWGMRGWSRRILVDLHRQPWIKRSMRCLTQPVVAWLIYVSAFLLWHDPSIAQYLLGPHFPHTLAPWLLLAAALLFWWPIVDTGPRFNRHLPFWLLIVYLFGVEIANMIAGITIAFTMEPLYAYYPALRAQLAPDSLPWSQVIDQIMGGAIIWVTGSFIYFGSIVFVLMRLFRSEGSTSPQPPLNWDDNDKFIAPGLEHRVAQNHLRKADLGHH